MRGLNMKYFILIKFIVKRYNIDEILFVKEKQNITKIYKRVI